MTKLAIRDGRRSRQENPGRVDGIYPAIVAVVMTLVHVSSVVISAGHHWSLGPSRVRGIRVGAKSFCGRWRYWSIGVCYMVILQCVSVYLLCRQTMMMPSCACSACGADWRWPRTAGSNLGGCGQSMAGCLDWKEYLDGSVTILRLLLYCAVE